MDKVWQREPELAGNPTLMLWVVLDGVEEKLPVQSRQRSLLCVYTALFHTHCVITYFLAGIL